MGKPSITTGRREEKVWREMMSSECGQEEAAASRDIQVEMSSRWLGMRC